MSLSNWKTYDAIMMLFMYTDVRNDAFIVPELISIIKSGIDLISVDIHKKTNRRE